MKARPEKPYLICIKNLGHVQNMISSDKSPPPTDNKRLAFSFGLCLSMYHNSRNKEYYLPSLEIMVSQFQSY